MIEPEVKQEFDGIQEQFKEVYKQFEKLNNKMDEKLDAMNKKLFLFEHEYGTKINAMYDAILLNTDKNLERAEKVRVLDKRVDRTEIQILDHDRRISILEMKK